MSAIEVVNLRREFGAGSGLKARNRRVIAVDDDFTNAAAAGLPMNATGPDRSGR